MENGAADVAVALPNGLAVVVVPPPKIFVVVDAAGAVENVVLAPNGDGFGLNGVGEEKLVAPNTEVVVPNFRFA